MSAEIVNEATRQRAAGNYRSAIDYVHKNAAHLTADSLVPALLQAFYSAQEGGLLGEARDLAKQIAKVEPGLPSIQSYL